MPLYKPISERQLLKWFADAPKRQKERELKEKEEWDAQQAKQKKKQDQIRRREKLKEEQNKLTILVLGGSQAAKIFAEKLPGVFLNLRKIGIRIKIYQQCLPYQNLTLEQFYKKNDIEHELFNFSFDIVKYYRLVNLVVSRAGSSALSELIYCNLPIISIPLSSAADNHQLKNAKHFESLGLAILLEENQIQNKLFQLLQRLHKDKSITDTMIIEQKKLPVYDRVEMLSNIVSLKKNIIITGSHGKTTTTSLIGRILSEAKLDPTIINGGVINSIKNNAKLGKGDWAVLEADESDGSFLKLPINYSIVTNLDNEHIDFYKNFKNLENSFLKFINRTPPIPMTISSFMRFFFKKLAKSFSFFTKTTRVLELIVINFPNFVILKFLSFFSPAEYTGHRITISAKLKDFENCVLRDLSLEYR